jgi:hypothetical protein
MAQYLPGKFSALTAKFPVQQMAFYDLTKQEREQLVAAISHDLMHELETGKLEKTLTHFGDDDTYIRKAAYLSIDVHDRYKDFAVLTQEQARQYIEDNF